MTLDNPCRGDMAFSFDHSGLVPEGCRALISIITASISGCFFLVSLS